MPDRSQAALQRFVKLAVRGVGDDGGNIIFGLWSLVFGSLRCGGEGDDGAHGVADEDERTVAEAFEQGDKVLDVAVAQR